MRKALWAAASCLVAWAFPRFALAANAVTAVEFKDGAVRIATSAPPSFTTFTMSDPPRLVIDISDCSIQGVPEFVPVNQGSLVGVRTVSYGVGDTAIARVMLGFSQETPTDIAAQGNTLVVKIEAPAVAAAQPPPAEAPPAAQVAVAPAPVAAVPTPEPVTAAPAPPPPVQPEKAPPPPPVEVAVAPAPTPPPPAAPPAAAPPPIATAAAAPAASKAEPTPPPAPAPVEVATAPAPAPAPAEPVVPEPAPPAPPPPAAAPVAPPPAQLAVAAPPPASPEPPPPTEAAPPAPTASERPIAPEGTPTPVASYTPPPPASEQPVRVSARRKRLALVGLRFGKTGQGLASPSEIFIRTNEPVNYQVSENSSAIQVTIENTRILRTNDARPLDARFFGGPVARVQAHQVHRNVVVEIQLKNHAPYQTVQQGSEVQLSFTHG